jgi:hypothetical protein
MEGRSARGAGDERSWTAGIIPARPSKQSAIFAGPKTRGERAAERPMAIDRRPI